MIIGTFPTFSGMPGRETPVWDMPQWIEKLKAVKNHRKGLALAEKLPTEFLTNLQIQQVVEECRATHEVLARVSSRLWTAVERIPDKQGHGYQIVFESNPDTDVCNDFATAESSLINFEIFPAVEFAAYEMDALSLDRDLLKKLGFDFQKGDLEKKSILILPDTELLKARWESFELPELKILKDSGILGDREFLQAQFEYDFVCSQGKEFIHDMLVHLRPLVTFISRDPEGYAVFKKEWTSFLKNGFDRLQSCKVDEQTYRQFLNLLSYSADLFSSYSRKPEEFEFNHLVWLPEAMNLEHTGAFSSYLDRTFGENRLPKEEFIRRWREIFREKTTIEKITEFIKGFFN